MKSSKYNVRDQRERPDYPAHLGNTVPFELLLRQRIMDGELEIRQRLKFDEIEKNPSKQDGAAKSLDL